MKLTEFNSSPAKRATKALKENYEMSFDVEQMPLPAAKAMLTKVRNLIKEAKTSPNFYSTQTSPSYMKLVFMEQALTSHYAGMRARVITENEEVDKSQVVLAAQDLVDSVQKMLEQVGQMQVKELPALVSSVESEIGINESQSYSEQASQSLDALSTALKDALNGMKTALGIVTGQAAPEVPDEFAHSDDTEEDNLPDLSSDVEGEFPEEEASVEEPEELPGMGLGRSKR